MKGLVVFSDGPQQLIYYPDFFSHSHFDRLHNELPWQQNDIRVFGKWHREPRLTCWFGPEYTYSSIHWPTQPFPEIMKTISGELERASSFPFNAVLANYYRDGSDSMGWHSDNEPEMDASLIASVTFGGKRLFKFRHKTTNAKLDIELHDRSLLLMHHMQSDWQHALPKSKRNGQPRINLTFRRISSVK